MTGAGTILVHGLGADIKQLVLRGFYPSTSAGQPMTLRGQQVPYIRAGWLGVMMFVLSHFV